MTILAGKFIFSRPSIKQFDTPVSEEPAVARRNRCRLRVHALEDIVV